MSQKVSTMLMFTGQAEEAMTFYTSLIPDSRIVDVRRYGKGEAGAEGTVMLAVFELGGTEYRTIDSNFDHGFTFTPASSMVVACDDEAEVDRLFAALSEGGHVMMPLAGYPFARKFAWVADRYGVSWQLSLT
ncbi:MAG: VOC family protein [Alphaproteobacteria bacterium]|nr:VOC family protein [Alphaproteobacteria bacterium]